MADLPPIVLVFAATDPSGGAGLQADIMTLSSMGCHPLSVVTAITIQDTMGVDDVSPIDAEWVADQARCVLEDMPVAAFKIGLLGNLEQIAVIAEVVSDYPEVPLVLDPVLASGRGDELVTEEMVGALKELLIPQTTILTPNSLEARRLAAEDNEEGEGRDLAECAKRIIATGCEYVLVTGTHENTAEVDQHPLRPERRGAQRQLAAAAGLVPRLGLHACGRHRRHRRQRPGGERCGQGRAGIHLADTEGGVSARHGPAHTRPVVLGARRGAGRWRRERGVSSEPRGLAAYTPSRPTSPTRRTCSPRQKRRSPAARACCSTATSRPARR